MLAERVSAGDEILYGIAVDDAHNYHEQGPTVSNPGRGWVMVRAPELAADGIVTAMEAGDFYGTSGVTLDDVRFSDGRLSLSIRAEDGVSYTTQFVGTRRGYPLPKSHEEDQR